LLDGALEELREGQTILLVRRRIFVIVAEDFREAFRTGILGFLCGRGGSFRIHSICF